MLANNIIGFPTLTLLMTHVVSNPFILQDLVPAVTLLPEILPLPLLVGREIVTVTSCVELPLAHADVTLTMLGSDGLTFLFLTTACALGGTAMNKQSKVAKPLTKRFLTFKL